MTNYTNNRMIAMRWWSSLTEAQKQTVVNTYFENRRFNSLTGREIEEIHTTEFYSANMVESENHFNH